MRSLARTNLSAGSRIKGVVSSRTPLEFILILILAVQFQFNSRVGDDWPNSNGPSYIAWRYGKITLATLWNEISYWIAAWANGQGRFFPMAVIQVNLVFTAFRTQEAVRIFYGFVFIIFCILWVSLIKKLTNNSNTATYFLIAFAFCMQFRKDFEPHIGFGQMLIWAAIWYAASAHMLLNAITENQRKKRFIFSIFAGVFYFMGLCHYELTFLMFPLFFGIIVLNNVSMETQNSWKFLVTNGLKNLIPTAVATSIYIYIVFLYLRPKANPDGAYVLGFDLIETPRAFLIQFFASFPLTSHNLYETFKFPTNALYIYVILALMLCYVITIYKIRHLNFRSDDYAKLPEQRHKLISKVSIIIGLYLMLVPSLMISLQPAWWPRLRFGSSYLGVLFAEIGISFLIASIFTYRDSKKLSKVKSSFSGTKKNRVKLSGTNLLESGALRFLITTLTLITILSNFRMIETTKYRDNLSASWSALTNESSFFSKLNDRDFLFSTTFNDAYEINVANVYEKTGIRLGQIFNPPYVWPNYSDCVNYETCPLFEVREKSLATLANYSRGNSGISKLTKEKGFQGDWPSILSKPQAIDNSSFWYFNIFMITEATALAYLVPMEDDPSNALSRPLEATLYTLTVKNAPVITPAFMGICLVNKSQLNGEVELVDGVRIQKWMLPEVYKSPSGEVIQLEKRLDIRQITTGSC
jgi:hypothetical protein